MTRKQGLPVAPVAPFAGAWIEMIKYGIFRCNNVRRSLRGSVD